MIPFIVSMILFAYGSNGNAIPPTTCSASAPSVNSCNAVALTVTNNASCTVLTPFIAEIGNSSGPLYAVTGGTAYAATSGNVANPAYSCPGSGTGTFKNGCPAATTLASTSTAFTWASGSKWWYGAYVAQQNGSMAAIPSQQQPFLNFTSGYANMGTSGTQCSGLTTPTVNNCLAKNPAYTTQTSSLIGIFSYDAGHFENHAGQYESGINSLQASVGNKALTNAIMAALGISAGAYYTNPDLSGAFYGAMTDYRQFLMAQISGALVQSSGLTYNAICTAAGATYSQDASGNPVTPFTCSSLSSSPFGSQLMYYSGGHWIEPDGAFSDAGAYGIYPWLEKAKGYYGIVGRSARPNWYSLAQQGVASQQCGSKLRTAWDTGVQQ